MTTDITDLTSSQKDYAIFLPAISGFFATYIGKQRETGNYVDPGRLPTAFNEGVEGMNWLNDQQGYFKYKWSLYSAGHANLDLSKPCAKEDMVRHRDRKNTLLLGDSGGFQIAKGRWEGNWKDPNDKATSKKRKQVLEWLEGTADYSMTLDIPTWIIHDKNAGAKTGIQTYEDAVNTTQYNNEYFIKNRTGQTKFLNVLQGSNHQEADQWYELMKKYCDPKQYPGEHFDGWGMGGQNMCDTHLILKRIVTMLHDGLLEPGIHDWMHFLGTSRLEWACVLTDIQRAMRKYHNPNFTVSFDCASPFLATANGQIYTNNIMEDRSKWVYKMQPSVDDKKYCSDTRPFRDGVLQDGIFEDFLESPISSKTLMKDICIYCPGDLNKNKKEGKTSWDSFSYAIQMSHNVWMHINAVQEANRLYDQDIYPAMLIQEKNNRYVCRDIINAIFSTSERGVQEELIESFSRFWTGIVGTRGFTGKRAINSHTMFNNLFDFTDETANNSEDTSQDQDDLDLDESKLEDLDESNDDK